MEEKAFEVRLQAATIWGASEEELAVRKEAFEKSGWQIVDRWELESHLKGHSPRPAQVADCYAKLGEKDKAFEWLEKSWSSPLWGNENAPSSFHWDSLRSDPRFEELLRKQNLPEAVIRKHLALPTR